MLNWKRKRVWIPALFLLLVLSAGVAVGLNSASGIQREMARWRAEGLPTTLQEWDEWYPAVAPGENAAPLVLEAGALHVMPGGKDNPDMWELGPPGTALTEGQVEKIGKYLEQNRPALDKLAEGLKLPGSRYPVQLWQGMNLRIDHLAPLKGLAQLLKWEALHHSAEGRREEAVRAVRDCFRLARTMRDEPVLITELVRIAIVSINIVTLQRVVSEHRLTREEILALANDLFQTEADGMRMMNRALIGERTYGSAFFYGGFDEFMAINNAVGNPNLGQQALGGTVFMLYKASGLRQRDARMYLETMNGFVASTTNDFPESIQMASQVETTFNARISQGLGRAAVLTRMLLPALLKAVSKEAILAARLRCARAALLVEEHRLVHDKLPEDVSALSFPEDPFTGGPLRFEVTDSGYAVISAGASAVGGTKTNPNVGFVVARR